MSAPSNGHVAKGAPKRRVGIVGYGKLGEFLCDKLEGNEEVEIAWVWNRTASKIPADKYKILDDLKGFASEPLDLVVEVAHPDISKEYGLKFLDFCDYYMGSPTAMADATLCEKLQGAAKNDAIKGSLYIPVGALWGAVDIQRMADLGTLKGLRVTMRKHPDSLRLVPPLSEKLAAGPPGESPENVLFLGPVRDLCPLAPNNVNTMACAAIAAWNLGFDKTESRLVADTRLTETHEIEVEVEGPNGFKVSTVRSNPAQVGAVTGAQTYMSFFHSLTKAHGKGVGVFFC
ncbi:unnamed protein product [Amoebophrya sp. A25]|nr:unnamed protein product [Amoebophrya sp. A25]|eukprot:GSA25T00007582001.1